MNGFFGDGGGFRGGPGYAVDSGVSVLAIVLRFTLGVLLILATVYVIREILATIRSHRALTPAGSRTPPQPSSRCSMSVARSAGPTT